MDVHPYVGLKVRTAESFKPDSLDKCDSVDGLHNFDNLDNYRRLVESVNIQNCVTPRCIDYTTEAPQFHFIAMFVTFFHQNIVDNVS